MDQPLRSDKPAWACGAHDYAPIHAINGSDIPRFKDLKFRAACGVWFRPAAIWGTDPGPQFLKHHGCKRCNVLRKVAV